MEPDRDVVITGMGVVSPIGVGLEAFWESLMAGKSGIARLPELEGTAMPVRFGGHVQGFDPKERVKPRKSLKVMCSEIQFAFAAADMAAAHARLEDAVSDPDRMGVTLGSEMFYADNAEFADAYRGCLENGQFIRERWGEQSMKAMFPLWMLKYLPNMPACHIGIALDARGPNNTIVNDDVSCVLAIIEAAQVIQRGWADVMIAGGTGSRLGPAPMLYRGMGGTSRRENDPERACRPFDAGRDGRVWGEGAACYVLESRRHAERRGQKPLARIASWAVAHRGRRATLEGPIAQAMERALQSAGLSATDIDHVNAHGASDLEDDRIEARAIRRVLGATPVIAPSSYFGTIGAGAGAVELAASLLALERGQAPPTLNYERPDPECPINVVAGSPHRVTRQAVLKVRYSPRGQAAALVVAKE